jgi:uncharacterized protein (TIGR02996 family)
MIPQDLSPLARWVGRPDFEALAAGVAAAPSDDAPRLVLADWLRDQGDEAAAALATAGRGVLAGWLAMAWYEQVTGRAATADMPHLTAQFDPAGPGMPDEAVESVRRGAAALIRARARGQRPVW